MIEVTEDEKRLGQNHVEIIAEDVDIVYPISTPHGNNIPYAQRSQTSRRV